MPTPEAQSLRYDVACVALRRLQPARAGRGALLARKGRVERSPEPLLEVDRRPVTQGLLDALEARLGIADVSFSGRLELGLQPGSEHVVDRGDQVEQAD